MAYLSGMESSKDTATQPVIGFMNSLFLAADAKKKMFMNSLPNGVYNDAEHRELLAETTFVTSEASLLEIYQLLLEDKSVALVTNEQTRIRLLSQMNSGKYKDRIHTSILEKEDIKPESDGVVHPSIRHYIFYRSGVKYCFQEFIEEVAKGVADFIRRDSGSTDKDILSRKMDCVVRYISYLLIEADN